MRSPSNAATTDASGQAMVADGPSAVVIPEPQTTPHSDTSQTGRVARKRREREPKGKHPKKGALGCHVLYDPPTQLAPAADVVFVHGLTGNSHDTWCHKSDFEHVDWPGDLLKLDLPDVRVLGFGYDADVVGIWTPASTNQAANHAENLLGYITRLRERTGSEDRPLLFVMHSLGGIVVQNALELSRSSPESYLRRMEASTRGLCFMGTPHLGSDKALWGSLFANILNIVKKTNRPIVKVLMPDSEALAAIQKRFHGILRMRQCSGNPIEVTCFYEEIPIIGIGVGMVQFGSPRDPGYESVLGELMRWVSTARSSQAEATKLHEECLRSLYFPGLEAWEAHIEPPMSGTCSWIWHTNFATWLKQGQGLFWIQGKAASGKSTLVKYIVREIKRRRTKGAAVISYHINKSSDGLLGQTKQGISRALLWKILKQKPQYFAHIRQDFEDMKASCSDVEWSHDTVHNALLAILAEPHASSLHVFIDGIDECSGDLLDVVDMCFEMIASAAKNVRICVASRPERELSFCLEKNGPPDTNNIVLEEHTSKDIEKCVEQELGRVSTLFTADILAQLVTSISQQANGFFMWAKLASRDVGRTYMKHRVMDHQQHLSRLRLLPTECSELYGEILRRRTGSPDYGEAIFMLSLVAIGTKEFTVAEFHRVATKRRWSVGRSTDGIRLGPIERLIEWSAGGLLEVRSNRVAFSHGTVYLFAKGLWKYPAYQEYVAEAYINIADTCLEILCNFDWQPGVDGAVSEPGATPVPILWEYAIHNWTRHIQEAKELGVHSGLERRYLIRPDTAVAMQRAHLARCWDHQSPTQSRLDSPLATTLAQMVLVEVPVFDLGQDHDFGDDFTFAYDSGENDENGWHSSRMPGYKDLDMLVTIQSAANYQISFHSTEALRSGSNSMACIITPPGANILLETTNVSDDDINAHTLEALDSFSKFSKKTQEMPRGLSEQHHPMHSRYLPGPRPSTVLQMAPDTNAGFSELQPRQTRGSCHGSQPPMSTWNRPNTPTLDMCDISPQCYTDPVSIKACSLREFRKLQAPRAQLLFTPRLLAQIKHVLYDYCRSQRERRLDERADPLAKETKHASDAAASRSARYAWATPMQYAAYHGLCAIIEELHGEGAAVWLPWDDTWFGSALIAAIWGVYDNPDLQSGAAGVATVELLLMLDEDNQSLDAACNAGRLGHISPLLAAVKLFHSDRRRSGHKAERLLKVISILLEEGAAVDGTARVMMRCHPDLKMMLLRSEPSMPIKELRANPRSHFDFFMNDSSLQVGSMSISSVGSRRCGRGGKQNTNASIGNLLPSAGVPSAAYNRLAQTSD